MTTSLTGIEITAPTSPEYDEILSPEALVFVATVHRNFEGRRRELLRARAERDQQPETPPQQ